MRKISKLEYTTTMKQHIECIQTELSEGIVCQSSERFSAVKWIVLSINTLLAECTGYNIYLDMNRLEQNETESIGVIEMFYKTMKYC